ncbi:MAG: hypothetical protein IJ386_02865, partial [Clostridia bacterium]|nr:hypothetical protein [Clostridia bacterium]
MRCLGEETDSRGRLSLRQSVSIDVQPWDGCRLRLSCAEDQRNRQESVLDSCRHGRGIHFILQLKLCRYLPTGASPL